MVLNDDSASPNRGWSHEVERDDRPSIGLSHGGKINIEASNYNWSTSDAEFGRSTTKSETISGVVRV
jgi:hypothetical protein